MNQISPDADPAAVPRDQGRVVWVPPAERVAEANLTAFTRWLGESRGQDFSNYEQLWEWSTSDLRGFWAAVWDYFEFESETGPGEVMGSSEMPGAEWFPGATVSFPRHIFRKGKDSDVAIRSASELRDLESWTYGELRDQTARVAAGLRAAGVGVGDRVAGYLPNIPEAIVAFLAAASLGAVWSCCSPDFGVRSVVDRFSQIEPKVLIAVDGYRYGGKDFDRRGEVAELQAALSSLEATVVLPFLGDSVPAGAQSWEEFTARTEPLAFAEVPFVHPLWILFSSGTTGLPKPIVQSHGGILLEEMMWLGFHVDCHPGDRFFWFSTTGWVMWNVTVSVLLTGASIVLFDGNPAYPDLGRLWDLVEDAGITIFGTSATYIAQCQKEGLEPWRDRDLSSLHTIGSTGSPLVPEGFAWVYEQFDDRVWLFSSSGGTDIAAALLAGAPTVPVVEGELAVRVLGVAIAAWDEDGEPLVGNVGELVVTEPIPSMPIYFWGDENGSRYHDAYFSIYPGVWRHGDWVEITPRGSGIIYGRSDATINRGGVRMGTSEIYRSVIMLDEVLDALVVDLSRLGAPSRMPLFVVLQPGSTLDDELEAQIRKRIRSDCSPRHVPDAIFEVAEIPKTLTGKILEVPVKRILIGADPARVASRDSLANPDALDWFVEHRAEVAG